MDEVELDRLERVRRYAAVPAAERDEEWVREFEAAFWPALLSTFEPVEVDLPEGRYLRVSAHPWKEGYGFARPAALVDRLIESGRGLFLTDERHLSMVWMNLGEVLSYRLYGRAFTPPLARFAAKAEIRAGDRVDLSPPHEAVFPLWVRINVRRHLQSTLGIVQPRAVWVRVPDGRSGFACDLGSGQGIELQKRRDAFEGLRWIMPRRIAYFAIDEFETYPEMQVL